MAKKNNKKSEDEDLIKYQCPVVPINVVVEFINATIALGGFSKAMSRDKIGILYGKHPNTFIYTLSAGSQYGLLSNEQYGAGYATTKRFLDIISPVDEKDKTRALYEAMNTPPLYKTIIERYNGRALPEINGFINLFKNEFGFIVTTADKGVKTFLENAADLNIIGDGRKLRFIMPDEAKGQLIKNKDEEPLPPPPPTGISSSFTPPVLADKMFQLPIDLEGDKMAYLIYPKGNMTAADVLMLEHMLTATISALKKRLSITNETEIFTKAAMISVKSDE